MLQHIFFVHYHVDYNRFVHLCGCVCECGVFAHQTTIQKRNEDKYMAKQNKNTVRQYKHNTTLNASERVCDRGISNTFTHGILIAHIQWWQQQQQQQSNNKQSSQAAAVESNIQFLVLANRFMNNR